MKITKVEKVVMIIIVITAIFVVTQYFYCMKTIKDNGGIKQLIIDTGKDVKEIKKEIEK